MAFGKYYDILLDSFLIMIINHIILILTCMTCDWHKSSFNSLVWYNHETNYTVCILNGIMFELQC